MTWTIVEESIPNRLPVVADRRDKLAGKISLNNLLEFLYQFGYEEQNNSNNSCSFESVTSSNIDWKVKSLPESVIFAELFFKLIYKDWKEKLAKMNRIIEDRNATNPKWPTKVFEESEFIVGYALIISASCYCQSGSILFNNTKE